ncbi:hypothetical protein PRJ39_25330 [Lysobacter enzymogenes]|uniref:hypothetical protein n=1 Tax=Lysobacter enzymogenes TaxID=69 RepID=UPI003748744A
MLGCVLTADAETQDGDAFRPVEVAFVSSGRTFCVQAGSATEASSLIGAAIDLQDGLARFEGHGVSASAVAAALASASARLRHATALGTAAVGAVTMNYQKNPGAGAF